MVSAGEHCDDLGLSFLLGYLPGVAVGYPYIEDLCEFVKAWVLAQERADLFNRSQLRVECEGRPCLGLEDILEIIIDCLEKAGVVSGCFQRDVESD